MLSFTPPAPDQIRATIALHRHCPLSYPEEGMTALNPAELPPGLLKKFNLDRHLISLGHGSECFEKARTHLKNWEMFSLGWTQIHPPKTPVQAGEVVAVLVNVLRLWTLNLCRVIEVIDEARSFGFSYGTLPLHAEQGEERFMVRRSPESDEVTYEITALSRPHSFFAKLGYFYTRYAQKRFGRESLTRMKRLQEG